MTRHHTSCGLADQHHSNTSESLGANVILREMMITWENLIPNQMKAYFLVTNPTKRPTNAIT
jgi:hypothetical protein